MFDDQTKVDFNEALAFALNYFSTGNHQVETKKMLLPKSMRKLLSEIDFNVGDYSPKESQL